MSFPFRLVNFVLQLLTAVTITAILQCNGRGNVSAFVHQVLEVVALGLLIRILSTHCVLGEEYGISVWMYTFILPAIACQSVVLVIFRLCCTTVGLDPIVRTHTFVGLGGALLGWVGLFSFR